MTNATLNGFRMVAQSMASVERTMTPAEMAGTAWGRVWQNVNVAPDGTRWAYDNHRNVFVAY